MFPLEGTAEGQQWQPLHNRPRGGGFAAPRRGPVLSLCYRTFLASASLQRRLAPAARGRVHFFVSVSRDEDAVRGLRGLRSVSDISPLPKAAAGAAREELQEALGHDGPRVGQEPRQSEYVIYAISTRFRLFELHTGDLDAMLLLQVSFVQWVREGITRSETSSSSRSPLGLPWTRRPSWPRRRWTAMKDRPVRIWVDRLVFSPTPWITSCCGPLQEQLRKRPVIFTVCSPMCSQFSLSS